RHRLHGHAAPLPPVEPRLLRIVHAHQRCGEVDVPEVEPGARRADPSPVQGRAADVPMVAVERVPRGADRAAADPVPGLRRRVRPAPARGAEARARARVRRAGRHRPRLLYLLLRALPAPGILLFPRLHAPPPALRPLGAPAATALDGAARWRGL